MSELMNKNLKEKKGKKDIKKTKDMEDIKNRDIASTKRVIKDREVRKREILDASLKLFIEKGYNNTSIINIVDSIHVAKGLFYYYFPKKEDVLIELENLFMEDFILGLNKILYENLSNLNNTLYAFTEYYFKKIEENQGLLSLKVEWSNKKRVSLESKLKETAVSYLLKVLENAKEDTNINYIKNIEKLTHLEFTIKTIIYGFSDLYVEGIKDKEIYLTITKDLMNL